MNGGLGTKMRVEPEDVRVGDFLTRDGFRRACAVEPVLFTSGRGKNRVTRAMATCVTYVDGTDVTLDYGACDKNGVAILETIYRQET